jgi:hypothetical protein
VNSKTALIFKDDASRDHWMTRRMLKRAGIQDEPFDKLVISNNDILVQLNTRKYASAVLMGEEVLEAVCQKRDILRWFNRVVPVQLADHKMVVVPVFEPKLLLPFQLPDADGNKAKSMRHPPRYQGAWVKAVHKAIRVAKDGWSILPTSYLEDPTPMRFRQWVDDFQQAVIRGEVSFLSWDIETPYKILEDDEEDFEEEKRRREKTVLRISFSYREGHAVSIPWLPEYLGDVKRLLAYDGYHVGWNSVAFDVPVLRANDVHIGGRMLDGMDAWHLLQTDLDKGIEVVTSEYTDLMPWKQLSDTMPALYSCIDSDAALRNIIGIIGDLEKVGLKERFFKEMDIIAIMNEAGAKGNTVDNEFRLVFKAELEALMYEKVLIAQDLVDPQYLRRKLLARLPKGAEGWTEEVVYKKTKICSACKKPRVSIKHKCEVSEKWEKVEVELPQTYYWNPNAVQAATDWPSLQSYLKQSGFNPCSANQMKLYMKAHRHPVGKNFKTKQDTADVKHLKKLLKTYGAKHPIYAHTLQIRLIQKALSTYVNGLEPDEHGLIYTTYVNSPSTWRFGSRNINVQNLGKSNDNPYAKKARRIITPRTGKVFVQADSSAIEAVMVGWFMGSEDYIKLARKGVHGYVTGRYLGETFNATTYTPADNERIKTAFPNEYKQFKQVNHGTNFGMGPYLMHMNDPEKFPTIRSAEKIQEFIFKELPELPNWHRALRQSAQKNGYLENPWKLRHYFYDVFNYKYDEEGKLIFGDDGLPQVVLGKDAKKVIAFKPQSSNAFFLRDNMYIIGEDPTLRSWLVPISSIHDSYALEVPNDQECIDYATFHLERILTRPIEEMGNLRIGCEISIMERNFLDERVVKTVEIE